MTLFVQACAGALLAVILILMLGSRGKEIGNLLSLAVCCMVAIVAVGYLKPVIEFVGQLENIGDLNGSMVGTLLKIVGIGAVSEIAALVCADAGNASLGKTVELLGTAVILWLSIPLFTALIELIQRILGEI